MVSIVFANAVLYAILWRLGHPYLFLLWAIPPMTILQVYLRIRGLAEHAGYGPNEDQRLATRTVVNPVQCFSSHHAVNFHIEHHVYPSVPYYNLPEVHRLMKESGSLPAANLYSSYLTMLTDITRVEPEVRAGE